MIIKIKIIIIIIVIKIIIIMIEMIVKWEGDLEPEKKENMDQVNWM